MENIAIAANATDCQTWSAMSGMRRRKNANARTQHNIQTWTPKKTQMKENRSSLFKNNNSHLFQVGFPIGTRRQLPFVSETDTIPFSATVNELVPSQRYAATISEGVSVLLNTPTILRILPTMTLATESDRMKIAGSLRLNARGNLP